MEWTAASRAVEGCEQGGSRDEPNIALYCRTHNSHAADRDYGRAFMDRMRQRSPETPRSPDRAGPGPARQRAAPYRPSARFRGTLLVCLGNSPN